MPATRKKGSVATKGQEELRFVYTYLPDFAAFLLDQHVDEYMRTSLRLSHEVNIPILRLLSSYTEQQIINLGRQSNREFLSALANNTMDAYIEISLKNFLANRIPLLDQSDIMAEDITKGSFIRRKVFRSFMARYTDDVVLRASIDDELEHFTTANELLSFNAYLEVQKKKLNELNAELSLREEQLLEAQDFANMGSFIWNVSGGTSQYTPGLLNIFEMTEVFDQATFFEHVHPEDRQKVRDAIDWAVHGDGIYDCEYRYLTGGKEKIIWSHGIVNFHEGQALSMKGTVVDVTNKFRILEQLKQSEELYKQAEEIIHFGNWSWDIESNAVLWSDEMYRIYGLEPQSESISFDRFMSLIHPDDRERRREAILESLKTFQVKDYVQRIINPNGIVKIISGKGQVILDKNGRVSKIVGSCQDISHEYHLGQQVQEGEQLLKKLIDNAPDSIMVVDGNGIITLWNPKTEEMFGWTSEEVIGARFSEIVVPPQYRTAYNKRLNRILEKGGDGVFFKSLELIGVNKNGHEFYVSLTTSQAVYRGEPVFIAFMRDITNDKQIKAELQKKSIQLERVNASLEQKNTELERMNQELESFNYVASHDLQEPLRKIQLFTHRIFEKGANALAPATVQYFDKIISASSRMQTLIQDLLIFSQTTAVDSNFEMVDLNSVLSDVKSLLSPTIEEKKSVIESMRLPVVLALRFQMQQLLINLIGNAIKYTHADIRPRIRISSSSVKGKETGIRELEENRVYYRIDIEDNGIGFDQDDAEKIFALFQRLHSREKYSGTGIGLAICRKIVRNHSGFISAHSLGSGGSVFSVYLPLPANSPPPTPVSN